MRLSYLSLLALAFLAARLPAQTNWVTNGDFSNGITGWTETGFSFNPVIETFDTTGLGSSQCYGCSPGGQVTPPPYAPNSIEQTVLIGPGIPYEFTAEITVDSISTANNADAGTFWVEVGGVEVTRTALGGYTAGFPQRLRLCTRFALTTGGPQTLRINFARTFLCNASTPRTHIDDIKLQIATGPTFCLRGNRKLGLSAAVDVNGAPNAAVLFFLSTGRLSGGIQIPGLNGTWYLDPTRLFLFFNGATNPSGQYSFTLPLPNDPALLTAVVFVQGVEVAAGPQINIGYDQFLTFVK